MKQTRHRKPFLMLTKYSGVVNILNDHCYIKNKKGISKKLHLYKNEVIILNKKKIDITERILLEVRKWQ